MLSSLTAALMPPASETMVCHRLRCTTCCCRSGLAVRSTVIGEATRPGTLEPIKNVSTMYVQLKDAWNAPEVGESAKADPSPRSSELRRIETSRAPCHPVLLPSARSSPRPRSSSATNDGRRPPAPVGEPYPNYGGNVRSVDTRFRECMNAKAVRRGCANCLLLRVDDDKKHVHETIPHAHAYNFGMARVVSE